MIFNLESVPSNGNMYMILVALVPLKSKANSLCDYDYMNSFHKRVLLYLTGCLEDSRTPKRVKKKKKPINLTYFIFQLEKSNFIGKNKEKK